jgi:hypothetical protein
MNRKRVSAYPEAAGDELIRINLISRTRTRMRMMEFLGDNRKLMREAAKNAG